MHRPIQLLAPEVADAIAAGEVVERPAAVVKELVENALDADARRVSIEVTGAGRTLVRVVDDGRGIPADQLGLAFLRHATSKVQSLADLGAVTTLGFRGEALASIAAVADVECRSGGARIRIRAGEILESGAAPPAPGTAIEVRDLFGNTPARLAFLKSDATETAACVQVVRAYAVLHPEVRWELRADGRRVLATTGDGDRRQALAAVHGEQVASLLRDVEADGVAGLVSEPRLSRGNRDAIVLAVNGRPIASRSLQYALEEAYLGSLEKGRYPVAVLDLAVDPTRVDVNVHPTKREVRFRDERALFATVQRSVRAALATSRPPAVALTGLRVEAAPLPQLEVHEAPLPLAAPRATLQLPAPGPLLRPLGQVLDGYLVAESDEGLVLVDQHAAHERILYNRFLARLRGEPGPTQPMLVPLTLDVSPRAAAAASDAAHDLATLGFEVEDFGPGTLRVTAAPVETPVSRIEEAVVDLLEVVAGTRSEDRLERIAASAACHSAVRFGDRLEPAEQRRLLEDLEREPEALTCPHGRPTRIEITAQELKRHFRRNY